MKKKVCIHKIGISLSGLINAVTKCWENPGRRKQDLYRLLSLLPIKILLQSRKNWYVCLFLII